MHSREKLKGHCIGNQLNILKIGVHYLKFSLQVLIAYKLHRGGVNFGRFCFETKTALLPHHVDFHLYHHIMSSMCIVKVCENTVRWVLDFFLFILFFRRSMGMEAQGRNTRGDGSMDGSIGMGVWRREYGGVTVETGVWGRESGNGSVGTVGCGSMGV